MQQDDGAVAGYQRYGESVKRTEQLRHTHGSQDRKRGRGQPQKPLGARLRPCPAVGPTYRTGRESSTGTAHQTPQKRPRSASRRLWRETSRRQEGRAPGSVESARSPAPADCATRPNRLGIPARLSLATHFPCESSVSPMRNRYGGRHTLFSLDGGRLRRGMNRR